MKSYLFIIAVALTSVNANAALNKWVDSEGKVHYSDTVPPEAATSQSVRNIAGKGQGDASASHSPKSLPEREADLRKSRQAKEKASDKKAEEDAQADAKKQNCESARKDARIIEEGIRVVTYDEKGERSFMDDETRAKKLEEARQSISKYCN
jgi:hypothetical protein